MDGNGELDACLLVCSKPGSGGGDSDVLFRHDAREQIDLSLFSPRLSCARESATVAVLFTTAHLLRAAFFVRPADRRRAPDSTRHKERVARRVKAANM